MCCCTYDVLELRLAVFRETPNILQKFPAKPFRAACGHIRAGFAVMGQYAFENTVEAQIERIFKHDYYMRVLQALF